MAGQAVRNMVATHKIAGMLRRQLGSDGASGFNLDDQTLVELNRVFQQMDEDGNGMLTFSELRQLWSIVFHDLAEVEVHRITEHIFPDIDEDDDGEISFEELVNFLRNVEPAEGTEVEAMFGLEVHLDRPHSIKQWVWAVVDQPQGERYDHKNVRKASMTCTLVVQLTILVSIVTMIVESLPTLADLDGVVRNPILFGIETACIGVFSVEFLLRTMVNPNNRAYWTSTFTWIDILAITPYYLRLAGQQNESSSSNSLVILRVLRMARMVRVLRVLKLGRNSEGIQLMVLALQRSRLALTWAIAMVCMAVVLCASLIFYVDKEDAVFVAEWYEADLENAYRRSAWIRKNDSGFRDAGTPIAFQSIPDAMWWALVTLTTVGYGDSFPVTPLGKTVGGIAMVAGLLVIAYPVTVISTAFTELQMQFDKKRRANRRRERFKRRLRESNARGERREMEGARFDAVDTSRSSGIQLLPDSVKAGNSTERRASAGTEGSSWQLSDAGDGPTPPRRPLAPPPRGAVGSMHFRKVGRRGSLTLRPNAAAGGRGAVRQSAAVLQARLASLSDSVAALSAACGSLEVAIRPATTLGTLHPPTASALRA
eukprot:TRINITY_DN7429_c0_g2_i1.p1 TRINITY_DN7429_c0_g2~~TRINITY_DN7429_c0_g2_i1.p1  ORF type:complete len:650 (+),score=189.91 TRINITY_DN7429_c0_g2_i1:161-1951(+)